MSITCSHKADVLLWNQAKLIATFHAKQYVFAAQCVWWISAIIGLQPVLVYFIDNQRFSSKADLGESHQPVTISRDNQKSRTRETTNCDRENLRLDQVLDEAEAFIEWSEAARKQFVTDPLCQTRQGHINPLLSAKAHLKKARRLVKRQEKCSKCLAEIRARIIENLVEDWI